MSEKHIISEKIVNLNVSGTHFTTYKATLCKYEGSMIEAMFSGRHPTAKDSDGRYFIDRPADAFKTILVFLQTGKLHWPTNKVDIEILKEEIAYYGLQDVIFGDLEMDAVTVQEQTKCFLAGSGIASANRDGDLTAFHKLCDNKGPTLTIMKTPNFVFGGYTEIPWTSTAYIFSSPSAWLFSLIAGNHSKYKACNDASVFFKGFVLNFGSSNGNFALAAVFAHKTVLLEKGSKGFLVPDYFGVGGSQFPLVDLEVFQVTTVPSSD